MTGFMSTGTRICGDCAGSIPPKPAAETLDDRHRIVVHQNLLSDHRWIARESGDPVVVAEHHDGMSLIGLIVLT
jgi:hypothetical protein